MTDNISNRLLEERARSTPEYWISRLDEIPDDELFSDWRQIVFDFEIDDVIRDHVFRYLRGRLGATLGSLRREYNTFLRENGAEGAMLSHIEWAEAWVDGAPRHFAEDSQLWIYDEDERIFVSMEPEQLAYRVALDCRGPGATKLSDYRAIARLVLSRAESLAKDETHLNGFAAGDEFIYIDDDGEIHREQLTIEHKARFKIGAAPGEYRDGLFRTFMESALDDEQRALMSEHFGAVLFGLTHCYQKALLWYGPGATGKSTLQSIIESMFPHRLVAAVPPHFWEQEYHAAALAGKALNVVGEIDDRHSLGAAFKNVIGGGLVPARHPTHQPFSFISKASHVFCTNRLPPTSDRSDAFWRRWSVIEMSNVIPESKRDPTLAQKIVADEMDSVLAFAMEGAQALLRRGHFLRTSRGDVVGDEWALETDSVLAFLLDEDWCELDKGSAVTKRAFYHSYSQWCRENGLRPLGSRRIKRELELSPRIFELGITFGRIGDTRARGICGLRIKHEAAPF